MLKRLAIAVALVWVLGCTIDITWPEETTFIACVVNGDTLVIHDTLPQELICSNLDSLRLLEIVP